MTERGYRMNSKEQIEQLEINDCPLCDGGALLEEECCPDLRADSF